MKTAMLHYWLTNVRGGEKVLAALGELLPEADIFTHAYLPERMEGMFAGRKVTESFIARLPFGRRKPQAYLPLMPRATRALKLDGYELIVSSESGPIKGVLKPKGTRHVCYCHTPMRYLWDMHEDYYRSAGLLGKASMKLFTNYLRREDLKSAESVDEFVANSAFVAERIKRIYGRDSTVVHPPVDVGFFGAAERGAEDYYLFAGASVAYKRCDLAEEACRRMGRRLVVAHNVTSEELRELYAGAKALVFPGIEDFGMVPVEAQAAGTPVIAFGGGGALETVVDGETGLFFREPTVDSLCGAIEEFEIRKWEPGKCRANARRFSAEVFAAGMQKILDRKEPVCGTCGSRASIDATVLVPAYNPDGNLLSLLDGLGSRFGSIVVVDDGSTSGKDVFKEAAGRGATVLVHERNRGKGAALKTGFRWIIDNLPQCAAVVTADADGQHRPDDIARVARAALENQQSLSLGVRAFTGKVPLRSRFGNWWTRQFFFLVTRMRVLDTQTGLRGIPAALLPRMLEIPGDRYEYEMAMLADARHHPAPPVQIPIETVYVGGNESSHFSPLRDSVRIYGALLHFCASSAGCFLLDNAIFTAVLFAAMRMTEWKRATNTFIAICAARAVSATVNYFYNRRFVFHDRDKKRRSFFKYWTLVLAVMAAGYAGTAGIARILDINGFAITALKIAVETALFFLSYNIQRKWVFSR